MFQSQRKLLLSAAVGVPLATATPSYAASYFWRDAAANPGDILVASNWSTSSATGAAASTLPSGTALTDQIRLLTSSATVFNLTASGSLSNGRLLHETGTYNVAMGSGNTWTFNPAAQASSIGGVTNNVTAALSLTSGTISLTGGSQALTVGRGTSTSGSATLTVGNGATFNMSTGGIIDVRSNGYINVEVGGTLNSTGRLLVQRPTDNAAGGAIVTVNGTLNINSNSSSNWRFDLGLTGTPPSAGTLVVGAGGLVHVTSSSTTASGFATNASTIFTNGKLKMEGGTVTFVANPNDSTTVNPGPSRINLSGAIEGEGTINTRVAALSSTASIAPGSGASPIGTTGILNIVGDLFASGAGNLINLDHDFGTTAGVASADLLNVDGTATINAAIDYALLTEGFAPNASGFIDFIVADTLSYSQLASDNLDDLLDPLVTSGDLESYTYGIVGTAGSGQSLRLEYVVAIPEPASVSLLVLAAGALPLRRRGRSRRQSPDLAPRASSR